MNKNSNSDNDPLNGDIIVQAEQAKRLYSKTYNDYIDCELLNGNEKLMFIVLKRYVDFSLDKNGVKGQVFPSLETIGSKCGGISIPTVKKTLDSLEEKGIIERHRRGLGKTNIYIIKDFPGMWECKTKEELKEEIEQHNEDMLIQEKLKNMSEEQKMRIMAILNEKTEFETVEASADPDEKEEKITVSAPSVHEKQALVTSEPDYQDKKEQNLASKVKERYSLEFLKEKYEYHIMIHDNPLQQELIDEALYCIYEVLNSTGSHIWIYRENRTAETTKSIFFNHLNNINIMECIRKYSNQTNKIKGSCKNYFTAMLYNAATSENLAKINQCQSDLYGSVQIKDCKCSQNKHT